MKSTTENKDTKNKTASTQNPKDGAMQYIESMEEEKSQRISVDGVLDGSIDAVWVQKAMECAERDRKVDPDRLAKLKAKIASGQYQVESEAIAKRFVEQELGLSDDE